MKLDGYEITAISALALAQEAIILEFIAPTHEIELTSKMFSIAALIVAAGATFIGRMKDLKVGPFQPPPPPILPPRILRQLKGGWLVNDPP